MYLGTLGRVSGAHTGPTLASLQQSRAELEGGAQRASGGGKSPLSTTLGLLLQSPHARGRLLLFSR